MAIIIKSERIYQGKRTLVSAASLTYGYQQYVDRVEADGGVVSNPAACEDAFNWMIAQGIDLAQFAVSPSWGIKQACSTIEKLYSFDGNDMVSSQAAVYGPYLNATGAYPVVQIDQGSNYFVTQRRKPIIAPGATGFCLGMAAAAIPSPKFGYFAALIPAATNYEAFSLVMFNTGANQLQASAQDSNYNPFGPLSGVSMETVNVAGYADYAGFVSHVNMSTNTITAYKDGVLGGTTVAAPGIYPYGGVAMNLCFGRDSGGGVYIVNRAAELWNITNCSAAVAQALSTRLGTLY